MSLSHSDTLALARIRLAAPHGIGAWLFPDGQIERLGSLVTLTPVNGASGGDDQMVRLAVGEAAEGPVVA